MEAFVDPATKRPLTKIEVAVGQTKVLGLKKFQANDVAVRSQDFSIAFCDRVIHLSDSTKRSYDGQYNIHDVVSKTEAVEANGSFCYQICGNAKGNTQVTARFTNVQGVVSYAPPVDVEVTENKKLLVLVPPRPFDILWANHPLNPQNSALYKGNPNQPCAQSTWLVGQCMVRFCTALDKSGVTLNGLTGRKCGLMGPEHKHHFIDPYDFEKWKGRDAYAWEAKPPLQPEPMPGIAAYYFTMSRRGVILFVNYFATDPKKRDMAGGHIDLWNRNRMGNTYSYSNPDTGLAAFVRSRKIVFWPLE